MTAVAVNAMPVTHDWWDVMPSKAMSWQITITTAINASHLICCRNSGPPAR
jgi:hypothetical protein